MYRQGCLESFLSLANQPPDTMSKNPKSHRSPCPIACTLDIIGDKWTLLVVRDLLLGRTFFREFAASPERIASNILTDRLNRLVEHGLAERFTPDEGSHDGYRLTAKGRALKPLIRGMAHWGLEHVEGTEMRLKPK